MPEQQTQTPVEASAAVQFRSRVLAAVPFLREDGKDEEGVFKLIASTDEPCDRGYYVETLSHDPAAVDLTAAKSVLLNHKADNIIGGIRSVSLANGRCEMVVEISENARTATGVPVREAVKRGYLQGVSIGYNYTDTDYVLSEQDGRTYVTVNRWELREVSLTPTPADTAAHVVRSLPAQVRPRQVVAPETGGQPMPEVTPQAPATPAPAADAQKIARDEALSEARDVVALARSNGLDPELYIGQSRSEAATNMLKDLAAKRAAAQPAPQVSVQRDQEDKVRDAFVDGFLHLVGKDHAGPKDLGLRTGSILTLGREFLHRHGVANAHILPAPRVAQLLLARDGASVTSGQFASYVLATSVNKVVMNGFVNADGITYPLWCAQREVNDFRSFTGAALDAGTLKETTENTAFQELIKGEGGYSSSLGLWGAAITLSLQAIINDDLSEFSKMLSRVGIIARKTIEKEVFRVLEAGTWTGRTTSSSAFSEANLDKVRAAMENATGPAGEKLLASPRFILCPPVLYGTILKVVTPVPGSTSLLPNSDLAVIKSAHLTQHGTPASSTYYLAANPVNADTLVVAMLAGMTTPQVEEFDAGANTGMRYKIYLPFRAVLPTPPYGMWQATA